MKKRIRLIILVLFIMIVSIILLICYIERRNLNVSTGLYLKVEDNVHMIIIDNSPIEMNNHSEDRRLFDGLTDGDKITIINDGIRISYPGKTDAYYCKKKKDGDITNIPSQVLFRLEELGWLDRGLTNKDIR